MEIIYTLAFPVILTLLVEVPIYFLFNKKSLGYLLVIYVMNMVLNILMNYLLLYVFYYNYIIALVIMEGVVVLIEGFIIYWFKDIRFKGLYIALLANAASLGIGLAINMISPSSLSGFPFIIVSFIFFVIEFALILSSVLSNIKAQEKEAQLKK